MKRALLILVAAAMAAVAAMPVAAEEIGFVETYILAKDKDEAIKQLIPGTDDYYYYQCLRHQAAGQYEQVDAVVQKWLERRKNETCPQIIEIQHRQALLGYKTAPEKSLEYLTEKLDLRFDHQRQIAVKSSLPTRLDPALISRDTLTQRALASNNRNSLDGFEPSALEWLKAAEMNPRELRAYLQRLGRPDYDGLAGLIAKDLAEKDPGSGGFGSLPIHNMLLKDQLDALAKLRGDLLRNSNFVNAYLVRLRPGEDVNWRQQPDEELAYLERMWSFVKGLEAAFNSLKANVLYHRLSLDRTRGVYDKGRFMEYLKLPRRVFYIPLPIERSQNFQRFAADLGASFEQQTLLPPIGGGDEPLIRAYLEHYFVEEETYQPYAEFVKDDYLKKVFAETKLLAGAGEAEKWTAMLPPEEYKALTERVDLDFAATNAKYFGPEEKIVLDVDVKNVKSLIVKVYRVNALKYYQQVGQPVPLSLDLDGLVANEQKTCAYTEAPLRRVRRTFEFAQLAGRGVYIIEFIGSSKRSRVLVQKGRLAYVTKLTPAGHEFTILDEASKPVPDAKIWMAEKFYEADKDGTITLPYTTNPTSQPIVLIHNDAATPTSFNHKAESYSLTCGFYVDREALLDRRNATLLVRPQLSLTGQPVSLKLLKEVELSILSTDLDGVQSTQKVPDFKIFEDRESTYAFRTPQRVTSIRFGLTAKVKNISQDKEETLSYGRNFAVDYALATVARSIRPMEEKMALSQAAMAPESLYLLHADGKYALEMRGRNGETLADRPVQLSFKHRDFTQQVHVSLKTDAAGRIDLGELADIERIFARDSRRNSIQGAYQVWQPVRDAHNMPPVLQGKAGQKLTVAYTSQAAEPLRSEMSLLEVRDGAFVADWFKALSIRDGFIVIEDLPAGDYSLRLKYANKDIAVHLAEGKAEAGYVSSQARRLELGDGKPVQIATVKADKDNVTIKLVNANEFTRVHVLAGRYMPEYDAMSLLDPFGRLGLAAGTVEKPLSLYEAGRKISDEYRYILDRQSALKYPGNMLKRPSLILNPWELRTADTGKATGAEGEVFTGSSSGGGAAPSSRFFGSGGNAPEPLAKFGTLDFLANGAVVLANLQPDKNGVVTIARKDLLDKQQLRILAVDTENTALRETSISEIEPKLTDRRLDPAVALDPNKHYIQEKVITPVAKGKPFTIRDLTSTRFETFDSLARAYHIMVTLSGDATLKEFAFITDWPKLTDDQKREKYSKYACHELNLFIHERDGAFFESVVLGYLKNKKDKTFVDKYLCGEDLSEFLLPWRYGQLNTVERVLLAQRIEGERQRTARAVKDLFEVLPPDVDRFNKLFDTALGLTALTAASPGSGGGSGRMSAGDLAAVAESARDKKSEVLRRGAPEPAATLAAAPAAAAPAAVAAPEPMVVAVPAPPPAQAKPAGKEQSYEYLRYPKDWKGEPGDKAADLYKLNQAKLASAEQRQLYRRVGQVKEWVENNYYHLPVEQAVAGLVGVNAFWKDYAAFDGEGDFLSGNFAEASHNFPEIMLALSVLDLPFQAGEHEVKLDGGAMTITPAGNAIFFHEEITEAASVPKAQEILVSQNYYRAGQQYKFIDGEQVDNFVTDEFLVGEVYACHVVVTNPTSAKRKLQVLVQVPRGAIPLAGGRYTKAFYIELEPYRTQTFDYFFYFPQAGKFEHFGVHVAKRGELVGFAAGQTLNVVPELTKIDKTSWDYISQNGSDADVLAFLKDNNLGRLQPDKIAWRMKDRKMFDAVTSLLAARHVYDMTLWSYAIKHNVPALINQYLAYRDDFVAQCGAWLESPLLTIQPVFRKTYQHMEYWPLVNARAHLFGPKRQILVPQLFQQYHRLMDILRYKDSLDDQDEMDLTCYLLLQDRVAEAVEMFAQVDPAKLPERIQHDYFTAYLDFYNDKPSKARKIAANYAKHPVERWRELFAAVLAQVDEIEGKAPAVVDDKSREEKQTSLAAAEQTFEFKVEARKIDLSYQNLASVQVNYYLMDIEQMFSSQPFVSDRGGQFAYIKPNSAREVKLPAGGKTMTIDMPAELANRNVMVEIVAGGKTRTQAYYSNSLVVQVMENYGQLRVAAKDGDKVLAKVYVKVYAKMRGGQVEFYKDGYTDLRGRFDYTSLNTNQLGDVDKFAILVLSEANGSTVREAAPPKQ
jgi:hypothetical protein